MIEKAHLRDEPASRGGDWPVRQGRHADIDMVHARVLLIGGRVRGTHKLGPGEQTSRVIQAAAHKLPPPAIVPSFCVSSSPRGGSKPDRQKRLRYLTPELECNPSRPAAALDAPGPLQIVAASQRIEGVRVADLVRHVVHDGSGESGAGRANARACRHRATSQASCAGELPIVVSAPSTRASTRASSRVVSNGGVRSKASKINSTMAGKCDPHRYFSLCALGHTHHHLYLQLASQGRRFSITCTTAPRRASRCFCRALLQFLHHFLLRSWWSEAVCA